MFCSEGNYYMVKEDDTFYSISRFYNVSLDDLFEANPHIEPDFIAPGQVLRIPLPTPAANCPIGATSYVVQKGDTFYSISSKLKIGLNALIKANPGLNPDALLVGQSICVPILWNNYESSKFKVKFLYPYLWSKIEDDRFEGVDGFFHVSAIASDAPIESICDREAHHRLKPYGTMPSITRTSIKDCEACFIMPSPDQPKEMHGQSALIVKFGKPAIISGISYNYLIIWVDKNHIKDIANTVEFLEE